MKNINKFLIWLVVFSLLVLSFNNTGIIYAKEKTDINISTVEDLVELAQNCTLDSWSQGKTIRLMADIDVSESTFESIPTFGGTFEGGGHTIRGLNIDSKGSVIGFFRYIQKDGLVKDLTVKGNLAPEGTKKNIGGIAGENSGILKNCSFSGTINGDTYVGGIAGTNEASGTIISCTAKGEVSGAHYIGGIAGQNLGTIIGAVNKTDVNITSEESEKIQDKLEEIDTSGINQEELSSTSINSTTNLISNTDIGGITGYSTGVIQSCENYGTIGYQHMGYNIGGIVGRQSGYVNGCNNYGEVYGRKDVGGIAGQLEPYINLQFTSDKFSNLQSELDKLQQLTNKAISDASLASSDISDNLSDTKNYVDDALDSTSSLISQTESLYNESIGSINEISSRYYDTLQDLTPIIEETADIGDDIVVFIDELGDITDSLEETSKEGQDVLADMEVTLEDLDTNVGEYSKAINYITRSLKKLKSGLGDSDETAEAMEELMKGIADLSEGIYKISEGLSDFADSMAELEELGETDEDWENLYDGITETTTALQEMGTALTQAVTALEAIQAAVSTSDLTEALASLQTASAAFLSAAIHLQSALDAINDSDMTTAIEELEQTNTYVQTGITEVQAALDQLNEAMNTESVQAAQADLQEALENLSKAITNINSGLQEINTSISSINESYKDQLGTVIEDINTSIDNIQKGTEYISKALEEISEATDTLSDNLDVDKIQDGADLIIKALEQLETAAEGTQTVIEDVEQINSDLEDTGAAVDATLSNTKKALNTLEQIAVDAAEVSQEVYEVVSDLAEEPAITFPELDSDYIGATNDLSSALTNISDSLGNLNGSMKSYSQLLLTDFENLNNQFHVVIDLLLDIVSDSQNISTDIEDYYEDVSDEDSESNTLGKILKCINKGTIQGDVNVAGISGSMAIEYDFDPEDDVNSEGETSAKFKYTTLAVIRECVNKGAVTSKKDNAGGIVGRMDIGSVISCTGFGNIESSGGDYVGGIAGASYSHIKDSFSMCVLTGNNNVGGIAGYGVKLSNNKAMVDIVAGVESVGAIAGNVGDIDKQVGNYFVNRGVAGIDGVSYKGNAEPESYKKFIKTSSLPEEFLNLAITFKADDKIVKEVPFDFGGDLKTADIPEVPEKEGYYGTWPDFVYDNLTFSSTLEAVYTPYKTVITSDLTKDGLSVALMEGSFDDEALLSVIKSSEEPPAGLADLTSDIWKVTLNGKDYNNEDTHSLRLLAEKDKKFKVYRLQSDGTWKKVKSTSEGSYLIVSMEGTIQTFCIVKANKVNFIPFLSGGMAILILVIVILKLLHKHRKRSKELSLKLFGFRKR